MNYSLNSNIWVKKMCLLYNNEPWFRYNYNKMLKYIEFSQSYLECVYKRIVNNKTHM